MTGQTNNSSIGKLFAWQLRGGILRGLSLRHLVLAVAFAVGYDFLGQLGFLDFSGPTLASRLKSFAQLPLHLTFAIVAIVIAKTADNLMSSGILHLVRHAVAVLVTAALCVGLMEAYSALFVDHSAKSMAALAQFGNARLLLLTRGFLIALYISIVVVTLYALLETIYRESRVLHEARLKALEAEREIYAAELSAMQARVDPDQLFASLQAVDQAYADDPAAGQRKLDELIQFLRAALPGSKQVSSS